jgi:hypothetical protein
MHMSILKSLFSSSRPEPSPAASVPTKAAPASSAQVPGAGELLRCDRIDWRAEAQLRLLRDGFALHRAEMERVAADPPRTPSGPDPQGPADLAVLWAMIAHLHPSRIIEVGCGASTHVIRDSFRKAGLAGEIIGIDPTPGLEIGEMVDAQLAQPVWEVPVADFEMLIAGEMLVLNLSHSLAVGSDVWWVYTRILPALAKGVIVGVHGIALPREQDAAALARGHGEQALLHAYLSGNAGAEILYAGGFLGEHHAAALREAMPSSAAGKPSRALWFRVG